MCDVKAFLSNILATNKTKQACVRYQVYFPARLSLLLKKKKKNNLNCDLFKNVIVGVVQWFDLWK